MLPNLRQWCWFSREYACNWGSCESCGFWTCKGSWFQTTIHRLCFYEMVIIRFCCNSELNWLCLPIMLLFKGIEHLRFYFSHGPMDQRLVSFILHASYVELKTWVENVGYSYVSSDLWAMGAIIAELFTLRPLFPGKRCFLVLCFMVLVASSFLEYVLI